MPIPSSTDGIVSAVTSSTPASASARSCARCRSAYQSAVVGGRRIVRVALRADLRPEHQRPVERLLCRQLGAERDGTAVRLGEPRLRVAELRAPRRVRAPRRRLEQEARPVPARDVEMRDEVAAQRLASILALEQRERRELRQVEAVDEDQRRLDAAVGEHHLPVELRQRHSTSSRPSPARTPAHSGRRRPRRSARRAATRRRRRPRGRSRATRRARSARRPARPRAARSVRRARPRGAPRRARTRLIRQSRKTTRSRRVSRSPAGRAGTRRTSRR